MDPVVVVSNRGPLSFRLDDGGDPVAVRRRRRAGRHPPAPARGLGFDVDRLLDERGRPAAAARASWPRRAAPRQRLPVDPTSTAWPTTSSPTPRCGSASTISSTCPAGHASTRRWREAWEGYRELNRQFARSVAQEAPEGSSVLVQDYHLLLDGPAASPGSGPTCGPSTSPTPRSADPEILRVLPRTWPGSCCPGWPASAPVGSTPAAGRPASASATTTRSWRPRQGARHRRPSSRRSGRIPDSDPGRGGQPGLRRGRDGPLAELVGDRRLIVRVDRVELSKNILRGLLGRRGAARAPSRLARAGWSCWRSPTPPARAWPSTSPTAPRSSTPWSASTSDGRTRDWKPIVLDVADDRARSVAALCAYDVLLVNPRARRTEPGGQGRPARQRHRRRAGALPGGGSLARSCGRTPSGSTPSTSRGRRRRSTPRSAWTPERRRRADALRERVLAAGPPTGWRISCGPPSR